MYCSVKPFLGRRLEEKSRPPLTQCRFTQGLDLEIRWCRDGVQIPDLMNFTGGVDFVKRRRLTQQSEE